MKNSNDTYKVKTGLFDRPILKESSKEDKIFKIIVVLGVLITLVTLFIRVEYKWEEVNLDLFIESILGYMRIDLLTSEKRMDMTFSLLNTLSLAFLATLLGLIVGGVFSVFAARNISPGWLASIISGISGIMRAIPTIVWVLIFVSGYGLSATTAVVGMFFHTFSFFVKSLSESYEEVSNDTIEALRAVGANKLQIVFGAIIPSSITRIIAWTGLRLEQNFGTAIMIGPAVGVPGTIGTDINNASRIGDYPTVGFGILLIFLTALLLETIANRIRKNA